MKQDRSEMEAARQIGLAKRHESRLQRATYTAAEVKVLTEAALRLGRVEAAEEIAAALLSFMANDIRGRADMSIDRAAAIALDIGYKPSGATSDATSGVPGHPEVSEGPQVLHKPFDDDGVTYCGWATGSQIIDGCGEVWPCTTIRAQEVSEAVEKPHRRNGHGAA